MTYILRKRGFQLYFLVLILFSNSFVYSQTYTFSTSGSSTWTPLPGETCIRVQVWGAGGAGGANNNTDSDGGGGGGGGGYSESNISVIPGTPYSYTVGAGGTCLALSNGGPGGQSFFINATTVMANGGSGGFRATGGNPGNGGDGALIGVGNITFAGGNGAAGRDNNNGRGGGGGSSAGTSATGVSASAAVTTFNITGATAPTGGGNGGNGFDGTGNGAAGTAPGGGGGGSGEGASSIGGAGANGRIVITVLASPTASNAGPDQSLTNCSTSTSLAGNTPVVGSGTWTCIANCGGVSITSPTSPTSSVSGLSGGISTTFRWSITNGNCTSTDDVIITPSIPPTAANAGPDQNICVTNTTLAGNTPIVGTGSWTCISNCGGVTITTPASPTSTVTGLTFGVSTTLRWTTTNGSCTSTDDVIINTANPPSTSAAGTDQTTASCVTTATLAGNTPVTGTGTWTCISNCGGVTITTPSSPTSGVTGLSAGVATAFRWTITNGGCTSTDDVIITGGACGNNDLCTGGIAVSCNNSYTGTTVGMNTDAEDPGCSAASAAGVWYILAGTGGSVTASLCGSSYDTRLDVFSGSSCASITTCVVGNDDFCGLQSQVTFATVIGTTYYILVNGFGSSTGSFTLNLSCCSGTVPNCATSPSPTNSATGVSPCGILSWTAATCNAPTSYDVYFGTTNPPPYVTNVTGTSYTPSLSGSTTYYWEVRPRNASGPAPSCTVWSFTTAASSNPQYNLVDDATSASPYECVTLTPNLGGQRGCAWDQNSTLGFASDFTYDWTINLGSNDAGADGMAFVIQNDPLGRCKCGTTGGSLGAGGITNSLIVEIDTYINFEDRDDFNTSFIGCAGAEEPDHLDIWLNGVINPDLDGNCNATAGGERPTIPSAVRLQNGASNYNIENGLDHKLRISWNAGTSTLTATVLDNSATTTYGTVSYSFNPLTVFGTNSPYFGFTGSTGGLSNQQTFCNPPVLLPVEMASFNLECDESFVTLNWSTNSENNNDYFTIQKSLDGINFGNPVAIINGAGSTSVPQFYFWSDDERNDQISYFRLSQVNLDGQTKVLNTVASNCSDINDLSIISFTQENELFQLKLENKIKGDYKIEINDMAGKRVYFSEKNLSSGFHVLNLAGLNLNSGIYMIKVGNSIETAVKKISVF